MVDHTGQRGFEARQVGSAFVCVNVIGVGADIFLEALIILQRDLNRGVVSFSAKIDYRVQRVLVAIHLLNKFGDAVLVAKHPLAFAFVLGLLVGEGYYQSLVEKRQLTESIDEYAGMVLDFFEYLRVCKVGDGCACCIGISDHLKRAARNPPAVFLIIYFASALDPDFEPFGERVDR